MNDPARIEKTVFPLMKTVIFTVVVPATVTIYGPYWLRLYRRLPPWPEWSVWQAGGLLLLALGFAGYLWCARAFAIIGGGTPAPIDPPKTLVIEGLYRYVRNPMYVSVLTFLLGESLFFQSRNLLVYAACVWVGFFLFVLGYEEPALRRKFGDSYRDYCRRVPRWIPQMPRRSN